MATGAWLPLRTSFSAAGFAHRFSCWLGWRVRFPFKARSSQSGILRKSLLRLFVNHLSDDTRCHFHRGFRLGIIHFGQALFCGL